ncbi:MAG: hypothetical protein E4H27_03810, partial [Anaerolineales bacterium]
MPGTAHNGFNTQQHAINWPQYRHSMQKSIETRWFFQGTVQPEVVRWFTTPLALAQPPRIDTYLYSPGTHDLGVKLREGRIEIKQRVN